MIFVCIFYLIQRLYFDGARLCVHIALFITTDSSKSINVNEFIIFTFDDWNRVYAIFYCIICKLHNKRVKINKPNQIQCNGKEW